MPLQSLIRKQLARKVLVRKQEERARTRACMQIQTVYRGEMFYRKRIPRLRNLGGMKNVHRVSKIYADSLCRTAMVAIAKAAVDNFWLKNSRFLYESDTCVITQWGLSSRKASLNCHIEVQRMIAPNGQHQGKFDTPSLSYRLKIIVCGSSGKDNESLVNDRGDVVISYPYLLGHVGHLVDAIELQRVWSAFQSRVLSRPGFPFEALEKHFVSQTLVRAISFDPQYGVLHLDGKMVLNYMRSHLAWTDIEEAALLSAASALCPTHEVQRFSHLWMSEFIQQPCFHRSSQSVDRPIADTQYSQSMDRSSIVVINQLYSSVVIDRRDCSTIFVQDIVNKSLSRIHTLR